MLYLCIDQSIQENEDDVDIGVGPAPEISDLLGSEYEHLYPKILYLVMADSAYCEGTVSFTSKLLYPQKYRYKTCHVQNMSRTKHVTTWYKIFIYGNSYVCGINNID